MSSTTTYRIGVILGSTRQPRVNPQVADFVISTINNQPSPISPITTNLNARNPQAGFSAPTSQSQDQIPPPPNYTLHPIDLATTLLPLFNEPTIPSQIHSPSAYHQPHTRAWSLEIASYHAFIFITPQYNWGYPAALKNAIDYLFNEWAHKPAMIVSYGGHGGGQAAQQLAQVLRAVKMRVVERMPGLVFQGREMLGKAAVGQDVDAEGVWEGERGGIREAFGQLMGLLVEKDGEKEGEGKK